MAQQSLTVRTTINGEDVEFLCEPRQSLLECLRDIVGLTGTKEGCNDGNCGACTVLFDGRIVPSCLVLGVEAQGREITTIEGIAEGNLLHPIQQAFLEDAALQCGICTPGFIVAAKALLDQEPDPSEERIRLWLANNLCRCTGYDKIVRAVHGRRGQETRGGAGMTQRPKDYQPNMVLSTTEYKVVGTRPDPPRRRRQGDRPRALRRRLHHRRAAARRDPAQPARARAHQAHRHLEGRGAAGRQGGRHGGRSARRRRPHGRSGRRRHAAGFIRGNVLATGKVLYKGHAVAAVAATSAHIAHEAAGLIEVEYEVLPHVHDARSDAMQEGAPLLHEDLFMTELGEKTDKPSNVAEHFQHVKGEIDAGFAEADVDRRARVRHRHRASGLHRAAQRDGAVEQRRPRSDLVQHAGLVRGARHDRLRARHAGVAGESDAHGDRRRLRRQDSGVPGAGGRAALEEDRARRSRS